MHPISAEKSTLTLAEKSAFHRVRHKPPLDRRDGRRRHDHAGPPDQELSAAAHRTCTALRPAAPDRRLEIWVQFPVLVRSAYRKGYGLSFVKTAEVTLDGSGRGLQTRGRLIPQQFDSASTAWLPASAGPTGLGTNDTETQLDTRPTCPRGLRGKS